MRNFKAPVHACTAAILFAIAGTPAHAVRLQGGGSSLIAPVMGQIYCIRTGGFTPPHADTTRSLPYSDARQ